MAELLLDGALFDTHPYLRECGFESQNEERFKIEEAALCIHLLDRALSQKIANRKMHVLNSLGPHVAVAIENDDRFARELAGQTFLDLVNERQAEYVKYSRLLEKNSELSQSLFWQASKHFTTNPVRMVVYINRFVDLQTRVATLVDESFQRFPGTL